MVAEQSEHVAELRAALATLRAAPLTVGIEREAWRIDAQGCPSTRSHPFAPDAEQFPEGRITVDFAENQAELVTDPAAGSHAAMARLRRLHSRLYRAVPGELLWPLSTPGCWSGDVQAASFAGEPAWEDARRYRGYLAQKYGTARQAISGVHFNVSFPEAFWAALPDAGGGLSGRTALYFAAMRQLRRYRYVLTYLFGASPLIDARWGEALGEHLDVPARALLMQCGRHSSSLRSGPLGYQLPERATTALAGVWSDLPAYTEGIRHAIATGLLAGEREFYAPMRPKTAEGGGLDSLQRRGVEYLEIRVLDLDPFAPEGVGLATLLFLEALVAAATLLPDVPLTAAELEEEERLNTLATMCSRSHGPGVREALATSAGLLWPALREAAELLGPEHEAAVAEHAGIFAGRIPRAVDRLFAAAHAGEITLREQGMRLAREHREELTHD